MAFLKQVPDSEYPVEQVIRRGDLRIELKRGGPLGGEDKPRQFFTTVHPGPFHSLEVCVTQGDTRRRLNDMLPAEWRLLEQRGIGLDLEGASASNRKMIAVHSHVREGDGIQPFFSKPYSVYIALHELGHIEDRKRVEAVPGYSHERASRAQLMHTVYHAALPMEVDTTLEDIETFVVKGEENADAFALDTVQRWRAEGIDVEPGVTLENLRAYAERNQRQYRELLYRLRNGIPRGEKVDPAAF